MAIAKQEKNMVMNKIATSTNTIDNTLPAAQSVYQSESMTLPQSVGAFIWYIVDEVHEDAVSERHKYISDHNPIYLPMNLY